MKKINIFFYIQILVLSLPRFLLSYVIFDEGDKKPPYFVGKSMISKEVVKEIVVKHIQETKIFLVDVKVGSDNRISVEIDSQQGISIEDCVAVSRAVEAGMNRDEEDFELEVSSPGLTQPFKVLEQYLKNCGRQVDVVKRDGQKINGLLQKSDNEGIILEVTTKIREAGQKRPKTVTQLVTLKHNDIKATKLALIF